SLRAGRLRDRGGPAPLRALGRALRGPRRDGPVARGRALTNRSAAVIWMLAAALALLACEEPEVPVGPPRCEPEHEHEVDRRLKLAFKALVLGDTERARTLFQAVL